MDKKLPKYTDEILYCQDHDLIDDEVGQKLLSIWKAGVLDDHLAGFLHSRIASHQLKVAMNGAVPFKSPQLHKGDYVIGLDEKANELRSHIQYLNAHCLTIAGSGAGKTIMSRYKAIQIARHVKGMWLFDLHKREYEILAPYFASLGSNLTTIKARAMKFNPLQVPECTEISDWVPQISDTLVDILKLGLAPRASKLIQVNLFKLYGSSDQNNWPTLYDLFEAVKSDKTSNYQSRTAILDSLEPVLLSLGPKVLAYRQGWTTSQLAKHHICFQFAGVSAIDKYLLLSSTILSEFTSRIAQGISNKKMDLWIPFDEAQLLASTESSAISSLISLIRGTGIGLDLSLQSCDQLNPKIVSNTATKIIGRLSSSVDYSAASKNLGLTKEQITWCQHHLEPGLFVGQFGEGSWRYPFIFRVPLLDFSVPKQPIAQNENPLDKLPTVYASEFDSWPLGPEIILPVPILQSKPESDKEIFASDQEYRFFKAVNDNQLLKSSAYSKLAKVSPKLTKSIRQHLLEKGYIKERKFETGGRGRSSILLESTTAGTKALTTYERENK